MLSTKFLGVDKKFFKNKVCLDAGCGANANATYNLLNLGAKFVHGIDINKSVLVTARKTIDKKFKGKSVFKVSNLLKIDYPDNFLILFTVQEPFIIHLAIKKVLKNFVELLSQVDISI